MRFIKQLAVLPFLLTLPMPWQQMHLGQQWNTHGYTCVVTVKTVSGMSWRCKQGESLPVTNLPVSRGVVLISKQPCQSSVMFPVGEPRLWQTPVDCYGGVYAVNKGDCFGWVAYLRPNLHTLSQHPYGIPGSIIHFAPHVAGASADGHWASVVSIRGNWMLISEENMYWRGGGYNKVTYRYLPTNLGGLTFLW